MAIFKISDLLNKLIKMSAESYEYTEITYLDSDEDSPESICFGAIDDTYSCCDFGDVESFDPYNDYDDSVSSSRAVELTDYCTELWFTYEEIFVIKHSVDNAIEYFKECLKDSSLSKDDVKSIKQSAVKCRNLQAKLASFLKNSK